MLGRFDSSPLIIQQPRQLTMNATEVSGPLIPARVDLTSQLNDSLQFPLCFVILLGLGQPGGGKQRRFGMRLDVRFGNRAENFASGQFVAGRGFTFGRQEQDLRTIRQRNQEGPQFLLCLDQVAAGKILLCRRKSRLGRFGRGQPGAFTQLPAANQFLGGRAGRVLSTADRSETEECQQPLMFCGRQAHR